MENKNFEKIPYGPIERPSVEEFSNFRNYVFNLMCEERHSNSGCIKVS